MAKGSKKYIGHEYRGVPGAKMGLGSELSKVQGKSSELRKDSKTNPHMAHGGSIDPRGNQKYADGGTIQSGIAAAGAAGGVPHTTPAGSTIGAIQAMGSAFGSKKAEGGKVKHDTKNLKQLDSSMRKFFKEEAQEKTHGGSIEAKNENQRATHKSNSKKDDKIPILASEGEVMLPRSVTKSKNAPEKAKNFMKKEMDKKK